MEYITKNELYEEIRIRDGLVLKIQKYKLLSYTGFKSNELKGNITKVGEKLHKLKKEIIRNEWSKGEIAYPIGTYIINKMPVENAVWKSIVMKLLHLEEVLWVAKIKL